MSGHPCSHARICTLPLGKLLHTQVRHNYDPPTLFQRSLVGNNHPAHDTAPCLPKLISEERCHEEAACSVHTKQEGSPACRVGWRLLLSWSLSQPQRFSSCPLQASYIYKIFQKRIFFKLHSARRCSFRLGFQLSLATRKPGLRP